MIYAKDIPQYRKFKENGAFVNDIQETMKLYSFNYILTFSVDIPNWIFYASAPNVAVNDSFSDIKSWFM